MDRNLTVMRITDYLTSTGEGDEKLLERVAEILGVKVAPTRDMPPCVFPSDRPCFGPDQVKCAHQLIIGEEYRLETFRSSLVAPYGIGLTIASLPFYYEEGGAWRVIVDMVAGTSRTDTKGLYLADMSILPLSTEGGSEEWNQEACLFTKNGLERCPLREPLEMPHFHLEGVGCH